MHSQFEEPMSQSYRYRHPSVEVEDYLDHLCHPLVERLPFAEREVIRAEVRAHIDGLIRAHCELGSSESEATLAALNQFGDPKSIGQALLREHSTVRGKLPLAAWTMLNLTLGAAAGVSLFVGIDCLLHTMLQATIFPFLGPDLVFGAAIGWVPALIQLRSPRPVVPAIARAATVYAGSMAALILFVETISCRWSRISIGTLQFMLLATLASAAIGALAGAFGSYAQRKLYCFAPDKQLALRRTRR